MTPISRHICECKLFIITKDVQIDLNIFIIKLVIYLKQKYAGINTRNSLYSTISAAQLKDKVFPDGECLHANIKDAAQSITCNPIKPNNIIHMKRALVFCDECPK